MDTDPKPPTFALGIHAGASVTRIPLREPQGRNVGDYIANTADANAFVELAFDAARERLRAYRLLATSARLFCLREAPPPAPKPSEE